MNRNVILIGPMGSGKTTVGRKLAARLGRRFLDSDRLLEERLNVDIATIFDIEGEAGFREREHAMLKHLCREPDAVIATGGGCVVHPENRRLLRRSGVIVYLQADVGLQLERLQKDKSRPLLQAPDRLQRLCAIAAERDPLYAELADVTVDAGNRSIARTSELILEKIAALNHQDISA